MADNNKPTMPTGTSAMQMQMPASKYHWWYDARQAGVSNTPPSYLTGHSPPSYSVLSQSPPAGGDPAAISKRRDSLKNMVHLCDFATP